MQQLSYFNEIFNISLYTTVLQASFEYIILWQLMSYNLILCVIHLRIICITSTVQNDTSGKKFRK